MVNGSVIGKYLLIIIATRISEMSDVLHNQGGGVFEYNYTCGSIKDRFP